MLVEQASEARHMKPAVQTAAALAGWALAATPDDLVQRAPLTSGHPWCRMPSEHEKPLCSAVKDMQYCQMLLMLMTNLVNDCRLWNLDRLFLTHSQGESLASELQLHNVCVMDHPGNARGKGLRFHLLEASFKMVRSCRAPFRQVTI